jgi:predicted O-methyltransferase YrrM
MYARKIAHIAVYKKNATQKITELSPLISLLKRRRLRSIVEIGTARGGTLYVWCKVAEHDALIVSIDLPGGPFGGGYTVKEMKTFRRYKRKHQKLFFLRLDSHKHSTVSELRQKLQGQEIDLLFIDGDHTYSGVKRDFQLYAPLVKRNGLIVFHDILYHPKIPQCKVNKFWNELKRRFPYKEFKKPKEKWGWGQWGGIGVLYYRGIHAF